MVKRILSKHDYNKNEIAEISKIVSLHMRSHGFGEGDWTDSAVRRLMNDAGNDEILEQLIIVFYADATTSNKAKLERHHKGIEKLKNEIIRVRKQDARKALRPALNGNEVMDLMNLTPGRELGVIMKFLNSDDGIHMGRDEAISYIRENF